MRGAAVAPPAKNLSTDDRIVVPAGNTLVGADYPGEGSRVEMIVPEFSVDRFAVSNARFAKFIEDGGYRRREMWLGTSFTWARANRLESPAFWEDKRFNAMDQPVTGISFYEAWAFAKWSGGRLLTEVEWEKAARGTDGRSYPWGDSEPTLKHATFAPGFIPKRRAPSPVQAHPLGDSPWGCRQMAGNVYEWVQDYFQFDSPVLRRAGNLVERRASRRRVLKGGAWTTGPSRLRPSARWSFTPELRDNILGVRVAYGPLLI